MDIASFMAGVGVTVAAMIVGFLVFNQVAALSIRRQIKAREEQQAQVQQLMLEQAMAQFSGRALSEEEQAVYSKLTELYEQTGS